MRKGFTLTEVIVAIALTLIVFLGIFGAYQLGLKVIGLSERKITATQIAQGEIEKIRNMPYLDVGTIGAQPPYASGTLEASTLTILNGVEYKIERKIILISDPSDGDEECLVDYKRVEIKVSFSGILKGEVILTTDVMPKTKSEELAICQQQPIGVLSVQVLNAVGQFVPSPTVEVYDSQGNSKGIFTPSEGRYDIPLSPGTYKVVVSKPGYSTERTYSIEGIAIPEKPNPTVFENQITQISFAIDKVSRMNVKTLSTYSEEFFSDSFSGESKISQKENLIVGGGQVSLATDTQGYLPSGYLFSVEISPASLVKWESFSFNDEEPAETDLKYQVYFASGTEWVLIPDSDLPGNSIGFDEGPVNLSSLSTTTYSSLKLRANFSTNSTSQTPILYDWQVSWQSSNPTPIPNVSFNLRGEKIIGRDANENPVYKYSTTTKTNSQGQIQISNLEWDTYHFSDFQKDSQSLELATSSPSLPVSLPPDTTLDVNLYLESQNSLLVSVFDSETLNPIFSATTTLSKTGFQKTQLTNLNGQVIFIPLDQANYTLSIEAAGYYSTSTTVFVSGKTTKVVKLESKD
jgi:prepilin-type N-terminal cleavage/methylation domain-containing protein